MKNSAWYHKLWRKKLGQYPLKDAPDTSWTEMQALLDEAMPAQNGGEPKKPGKFWGGTVISMLGYILPAAAMIGAATFVAIKHAEKTKTEHKHHRQLQPKKAADNNKVDTEKNALPALKPGSAADSIPPNITPANAGIVKNSATNLQQTLAFSQKNKTGAIRTNQPPGNLSNSASAAQPGASTARLTVNPPVVADENAPAQHAGSADKPTDTALLKSTQPGSGKGTYGQNYAGAKAPATNKRGAPVSTKPKAAKSGNNASKFDFSINGGINVSGAGSSPVFGLTGTVGINPKWEVEAGIGVELNRPVSVDITHPSYNRPDSGIFKVQTSRKINTVTVPVNLVYKVSDKVSLFAGPQVSFSGHQSTPVNKLRAVTDYRDTLSHSRSIDSALKYNSISKVNVGVSAGASISIGGHFYIDGVYQQNISPFKVSTGLGNNKQYYRSFQIGLRYRFKKKAN